MACYFPGWLLLRTLTVDRKGLERHAEMACLAHTGRLGKPQQQGGRAARGSHRDPVGRGQTGPAEAAVGGRHVTNRCQHCWENEKAERTAALSQIHRLVLTGRDIQNAIRNCAPCRTQNVCLDV